MTVNDGHKPIHGFGFPDDELRQSIAQMPIRILIAEDEESIRELLRRTLSQENYEVDVAVDGEEAWQRMEDISDTPRIAILDWMMPKLDGLTLCRRIKERQFPFVYVLMLTAKTENEDAIAALRAGADEFLTKPFNLDVLRSRVAAGARIVRLENLLTMKNSILESYIDKLENVDRKNLGIPPK